MVASFNNVGYPKYLVTTTNLPQDTNNLSNGTKITYNVRDHPRVAFLTPWIK